jgi:hypothetical protein
MAKSTEWEKSQWVCRWPHLRYLFFNGYFFLYYCAGWGYTVTFAQVLTMYPICHTWIHPLYSSPLPSPPQIPGIVSTGINFAFIHMCTHFLHRIHPPTSFPIHLPSPMVSALPPGQDLFYLLFSNFVEEKREKRKWKTWHGSFLVVFPCMYVL